MDSYVSFASPLTFVPLGNHIYIFGNMFTHLTESV